MTPTLEDRALLFAVAAHAACGQKRKYTGEAYYLHPIEVRDILSHCETPVTNEMRAAALLHDVVEDTQVSIELIRLTFGDTVADYVEQLTDVSKPEHGNRAARKALDRAHTASASSQAKTIKLADLISNTRSIVERDPVFAVTYLAEKRLLLEVLVEGDPALLRIATQLAKENPRAGGL